MRDLARHLRPYQLLGWGGTLYLSILAAGLLLEPTAGVPGARATTAPAGAVPRRQSALSGEPAAAIARKPVAETRAPAGSKPTARKTAAVAGKPAPAAARPASMGSRPGRKTAAGFRATKRTTAGTPSPAIAYRKVVTAGVPMHVVQIDPRRPEVRIAVATARDGIGYRDTWSGMIHRARPAAAITGTYFGLACAIPVGSIVVEGKTIHRGLVGTAFAYNPGQGPRLVACRPGADYDWSAYETVVRAGPRLLTGGRRTLWPQGEGFRDPNIFARKRRTAVGITRSGKLLLVAVEKPVLLRTLAQALQSLGVTDAMCMDGGSSTGLYYRGKSWVVPKRALTNVIVVYDSVERYRQQAASLAPRVPRLAGSLPGRM